MEEIYYNKNLGDLTNRQLDSDYQQIFLENRMDYPEELDYHHEQVNRANPAGLVEPAESRNMLYNFIRDFYGNKQSVKRRRLSGGKKSKRRKCRKSRKSRKTRRNRKGKR